MPKCNPPVCDVWGLFSIVFSAVRFLFIATMPTYVYETINADGTPGEHFEVLQGIDEAPLTEHPESGLPVRRVLTAAFVSRPWGSRDKGTQLADRNLEKMGFTKYVRGPQGYEKTMGDGPDLKPRNK